jgi:hypothetical protein
MLCCGSVQTARSEKLSIANFSDSGLTGWDNKVFSDTTSYQLVKADKKMVLLAESRNSASAIVRKIRVDLKKYPYLNWSWKIRNRLSPQDEKVKSGDDYAARIYVVVDGGFLPWKTKAVNYVWANLAAKGSTWPNAFAGKNVIMLALKNKNDKTETWYPEKRNVYDDLQQFFGKEIQFIDAVALMTDTDNSHGQAISYYGNIYFSSD